MDSSTQMSSETSRVPKAAAILPPGVSLQSFNLFMSKVRTLAPGTKVIDDPEELLLYRDPFSPKDPDANACSAVLQPAAVAEVQAIVRLASQFAIPLWTISRGKNNGYGGPAPKVGGSVVVEMQRMNRILEVDEKLCTALVEPGVTFFDLYNYCKERNLKVYPSCPSLGWGSVVGNTLDRGCGYTPQGEHAAAQCGLEVVLANGDVVRTGMGALTNSSTWQCYRAGFGPSIESLFNQSNLGIVTKMGVWLTPKQQGFMSCSIDVEREEDIVPLVDNLAALYREDILQNHPIVGNVVRHLARTAPRSTFYNGPGAIPDEILEKVRKENNLGFWNARFAFYGTEMMMKARWAEVCNRFANIEGTRMTNKIYLASNPDGLLDADEVPVDENGGTQIGLPNMLRLQSIKYRGRNGGHVSFSPILPSRGKDVLDFYFVSKSRAAEYGYDFHAGIHIFPRYTIHLNLLFFENDDPTERISIAKCYEALIHDAAASGYSEYRAHIEWMDLIADQFDFNNHALRRFNEKMKDAFDPEGILSPGKSGIWGKKNWVGEGTKVRAMI